MCLVEVVVSQSGRLDVVLKAENPNQLPLYRQALHLGALVESFRGSGGEGGGGGGGGGGVRY